MSLNHQRLVKLAIGLVLCVGTAGLDPSLSAWAQSPPEGTTFSEVTYSYHVQGRSDHGGHGIAFVDVTGDGYPDLYVTNAVRDLELDDLFLFNENGSNFDDRTSDYKLWDPGMSHGIVAVDVDNDGDLDYFNGNTDKPCRLYINKGTYFADETFDRGIQYFNGGTRGVVAFDMDNDGDMDLYAGNWGDENETYINDGTGHFTRVDVGANDPQGNDDGTQGVTVADFDNDGDMDIFVAMRGTECRLFVNDGTGHFTRGESAAGVIVNAKADGGTFADIDNDGDLDLFVVKYHEYSGQTVYMNVFRNNGDGTFTDETDVHGIVYDGYMAALGDLDNDGDLDIVTAPHKDVVKVYLNDGTGHFHRLDNMGSAPYRGDPRGIALADMDLDGDLDIYIAVKDGDNVLLRNNLDNGNRWLRVAVTGWAGDYGGIGTRLYAYDPGHAGERDHLVGFREITSASGYVGQSDLVQHFGLGLRDSVDLVARFTDGTRLVLRSVAANQTVHIRGDFARYAAIHPQVLQATGGDGQSGPFGSRLPEPLEVLVQDEQGNPLPGVAVDFSTVSGEASFSVDSLALGQPYWEEAENARLLDSGLVAYDSTASGGHFVWLAPHDTLQLDYWSPADTTVWVWLRLQGYTDDRQVWVKAGTDSSLIEHPVGSGWMWARTQRKLHARKGFLNLIINNDSLALWVDKWVATTDSTFTPAGTGGSNSDQPWVTDASGKLQTFVTLEPPDTQIVVRARLADSTLVANWTLHGHPTKVARVVVVSGDSQTVYIGRPSQEPLTVLAESEDGQPVPGKTIRYRLVSGEGVFTPADTVVTGSDGQAAVTFTAAGDSGEAVISASAVGEEADSALFHLHVKRTPHTLIAISPTDTSAVVADTLRLLVRILDAQDRPVPRDSVRFSVQSAQGWFMPDSLREALVFTDENGYGQVDLLLGQQAGYRNHVVEARSAFQGEALDGSPLNFQVTALADTARRLVLVRGNGQSGTVGQPLPEPVVARVEDRYGNGVPDFNATFQVVEGGGSISGADSGTVATDSLGQISLVWTLGTVAGSPQTLRIGAELQGRALEGSPLTVSATAQPGPVARIRVIGGNHQVAQVGTTLPESLRVQVTDGYGNGIKDVAVDFAVISGSGSFGGQTSRRVETDSSGSAGVSFTLGTTSGYAQGDSTRISATVVDSDVAPALFAVWPVPGPAVALVDSGGDGQTGAVGDTLAVPFVARVLDEFGNGVVNSPVIFSVRAGGGHFLSGGQADTVQTDTLGFARVRLVLGTVPGQNNNRVVAFSPAVDDSLVFVASGEVGPAAKLLEVSGNNQSGYVGETLPEPLVVQVTDAYGNGVPDHPVTFRVKSGAAVLVGGDSVQTVPTDSAGKAQVSVELDTTASGDVIIWAEAEQDGAPLQGSPVVFHARPLASGMAVFEIVSGNGQTGMVGQTLPESLVVRVRDPYGNPHGNWPVHFVVVAGGGKVDGQDSVQVNTDSSGLAAVAWQLGHRAGQQNNRVVARVSNADPEELEFVASAQPGPPAYLIEVRGNRQRGYVMNVLPDSLEVRLQDAYGNPNPDVPVAFRVVAGGGKLNGAGGAVEVPTDSTGTARAAWTLGPVVGTQKVEVTVSGGATQPQGSPLVFEAEAQALAPERLVIVSGDNQEVVATRMAPEPLTVAVEDSVGNGVAGVPVTFRVLDHLGQFVDGTDSTVVITDSTGRAAVRFQLACAEGRDAYVVEAAVSWQGQPLDGSPALFHLTGLPRGPMKMSVVEGDGQVTKPGHPFPHPFAAAVLDSCLNGIPNVPVTFACAALASWPNGDTLITVQTDSFGIATTNLTAGPELGYVDVKAWVPSLRNDPAIFRRVFIHAAEAQDLSVVSGDSQTVRVGATVAEPLVVRATTSDGQPVEGEVITYQLDGELATPVPTFWATTDANGEAGIRVCAIGSVGRIDVRASLASNDTKSVLFHVFVVPNKPPVLHVPSDTTVAEGDSLALRVWATDPDGDAVTIRFEDLPSGATVDSTAGYMLCWRPNYRQSGDWPIHVVATDTLGASSMGTLTIHVTNVNRPPMIVSWQPRDSLVSLSPNEVLVFSVNAVDPDSDVLSIEWVLDGQEAAQGAEFTLPANDLSAGRHLLQVLVSDGDKNVSRFWWLDIVTAVQLQAFEAHFREAGSVELLWKVTDPDGVTAYALERRQSGSTWTCVARLKPSSSQQTDFRYRDVPPAGNPKWTYRLVAEDADGRRLELGQVTVEIPLPKRFRLYAAFPNPFNPTTNIRLDVPRATPVQIRVFDLEGRLVRTLVDKRLSAGYHRFQWDARNERGLTVPSGTYLVVGTWPGGRQVQKVVLLK